MTLFGLLVLTTFGTFSRTALQETLQLRQAREQIPRLPLPSPPCHSLLSVRAALSASAHSASIHVAQAALVSRAESKSAILCQIVTTITFTGTHNDSASSSIYTGRQVVIVKADGSASSSGDSWEVHPMWRTRLHLSDISVTKDYAYPQAFGDEKRVLVGAYIIDCDGREFAGDEYGPYTRSV